MPTQIGHIRRSDTLTARALRNAVGAVLALGPLTTNLLRRRTLVPPSTREG